MNVGMGGFMDDGRLELWAWSEGLPLKHMMSSAMKHLLFTREWFLDRLVLHLKELPIKWHEEHFHDLQCIFAQSYTWKGMQLYGYGIQFELFKDVKALLVSDTFNEVTKWLFIARISTQEKAFLKYAPVLLVISKYCNLFLK